MRSYPDSKKSSCDRLRSYPDSKKTSGDSLRSYPDSKKTACDRFWTAAEDKKAPGRSGRAGKGDCNTPPRGRPAAILRTIRPADALLGGLGKTSRVCRSYQLMRVEWRLVNPTNLCGPGDWNGRYRPGARVPPSVPAQHCCTLAWRCLCLLSVVGRVAPSTGRWVISGVPAAWLGGAAANRWARCGVQIPAGLIHQPFVFR